VPPVEAWVKVWIDEEVYAPDVHASLACTACHGGQAVRSMSAHEGLIADPSADPAASDLEADARRAVMLGKPHPYTGERLPNGHYLPKVYNFVRLKDGSRMKLDPMLEAV